MQSKSYLQGQSRKQRSEQICDWETVSIHLRMTTAPLCCLLAHQTSTFEAAARTLAPKVSAVLSGSRNRKVCDTSVADGCQMEAKISLFGRVYNCVGRTEILF